MRLDFAWFTDFENEEFKATIHGWYYLLNIKKHKPGRVFIYSDGGKWKQVEKGGAVSYEIWEKKGEEAFKGMACTIMNGDTIWKEKLDLLVEGKEVVYYANVPENDGTPLDIDPNEVLDFLENEMESESE